MNDLLFAFALTLFAGLATGIGSVIAFFAKRTNYRFLSVSTGFSAGVMLYVSFVEILAKGHKFLAESYTDNNAQWINTASFFAGILMIGLIDKFVPSEENPHHIHSEEETAELSAANKKVTSHARNHEKLMRTGLFTALAIGIHNFPEGFVTFLTALHDPGLGIAIAVAIALHNIPEGISVSVPIYYATGNRRKAFLYSLASGLAEPVGAAIAYTFLRIFVGHGGVIPTHIMGMLFGGVAGVMVYISLDELLPASRAYGKEHDSILGVAAGMALMALSLLLMQ